MKKILLSLLVLASSTMIMAQSHGAMTFVGASTVKVFNVSMSNDNDTVKFTMNDMTSGDIVIPKASYEIKGVAMSIPSFTIHNATFAFANMVATFTANQTFTETITVNGEEKTITGKIVSGEYAHATNTLDLNIVYKYGVMPYDATYTITGYYVKSYTDELSVCIGGVADYTYKNDNVTYNVRKYMDGDVEKLDVEVPTYVLTNTVMGDLTIGGYTVKGLTYDDAKGGYYKDYANDGLSMHFTAVSGGVTSMDKDYALSNKDGENILVTYNSDNTLSIVNTFKPGAMPYDIVSTFTETKTSGIYSIETEDVKSENSAAYNLAGQRVNANAKGIVIINGKKYLNK